MGKKWREEVGKCGKSGCLSLTISKVFRVGSAFGLIAKDARSAKVGAKETKAGWIVGRKMWAEKSTADERGLMRIRRVRKWSRSGHFIADFA